MSVGSKRLAMARIRARSSSARALLLNADRLNAPRHVIDALCRWIAEIETTARNAGLIGEDETCSDSR